MVRLIAWQIIVSAALVLLGCLALGLPPGALGALETGWLGLLLLAYLASTLPPSTCSLTSQEVSVSTVIALTATVFVAAWLISPVLVSDWMNVWPFLAGQKEWELLNWPIPLRLFLTSASFAMLSNVLLTRSARIRQQALLALSAVVILLLVCSLPPIRGPWLFPSLERPVVHQVEVSKYRLRISYFRERVPPPVATGGSLLVLDDRMLLMAGDGWFYELQFSGDGARLEVRPLRQRVPLNHETFALAHPSMSDFLLGVFRASDMLLLDSPENGKKDLLASHHFFHEEKDCYSVRVSALTTDWEEFLSGAGPARWRTVYEAQPCLPLRTDGKLRFTGHQTGGALVQAGAGKVLLALGDGGFDGVQSLHAVSQDTLSDFGKIVEIVPQSGKSRIVASGLRSPADLHVDTSGRVWLTEHGPRGGDELNRFRSGGDYGWPQHTLGTQYNGLYWPPQVDADAEKAFEPPAFAWIPSIGISALVGLSGPEFEHWRGDLIVSSLVDRALYRMQLAGDTPILAERIPVFERVRDVVLDSRGRLVFWTDRAVIGRVEVAR